MFTSSANDAHFDNKTNPYMEPTTPKVLIVAILLAFSDTGYNIIGNTAIGLLFQSDSDVGFMLLNSVMSCGTAFMFFTSCYFSLYTILAVEVIFCTLSTLIITLNLMNV